MYLTGTCTVKDYRFYLYMFKHVVEFYHAFNYEIIYNQIKRYSCIQPAVVCGLINTSERFPLFLIKLYVLHSTVRSDTEHTTPKTFIHSFFFSTQQPSNLFCTRKCPLGLFTL